MALSSGTFWVVDVEGNGARPPEIVEMAFVEVAGLALSDRRRHWLVRPERSIEPIASRIHGLKDADVADAPSIDDISDEVLTWLDDAAVVGHNVRVELDAISRPLPDWSPRMAIDTLGLAKALRPDEPSYSLEKLGKSFGLTKEAGSISGKRHHSALYDAVLTALLFTHLLAGLSADEADAAIISADLLAARKGTLL